MGERIFFHSASLLVTGKAAKVGEPPRLAPAALASNRPMKFRLCIATLRQGSDTAPIIADCSRRAQKGYGTRPRWLRYLSVPQRRLQDGQGQNRRLRKS